jgi:hypothetical protein
VRYMLLIYGDERVWSSLSEEDMRRIYADHNAYGAEMTKAGVLLGGAELRPVATATSIRGYYVIEVDNLDRAIEWAERMPGMSEGTVEIRPFAPVNSLPCS